MRYQIARFCQWEAETAQEYRYRITPASLERARQQGLRTSPSGQPAAQTLRRPAAAPLLQALERWEKFGTQATPASGILLRVGSPEILTALRKTRAARYLGEALNPHGGHLAPAAKKLVLHALAKWAIWQKVKLE